MSEGEVQGATLTEGEGYLAMYYFIDAYCMRGVGADQLRLLWSDLFPTEDPQGRDPLWTQDPAFWSDWTRAVARAKAEGLPQRPN
ncbi:MAG: hypothetical protein QOG88_1808 [Actinomycetota bacterium]|jgi:hypothetical protein|nr:hypothetical protein [Actinomycetota bacterium]